MVQSAAAGSGGGGDPAVPSPQLLDEQAGSSSSAHDGFHELANGASYHHLPAVPDRPELGAGYAAADGTPDRLGDGEAQVSTSASAAAGPSLAVTANGTAAALQHHQANGAGPYEDRELLLVGDAELSAEPEGAEATARKKPKGNVKVNFNSEVEYLGPKDGSAVYVESEEQHLRRVLASSIVGNTLEWYDFLIFIFLGNIISALFFPPGDVYANMISFYGVFAAGFVTRPLGALVFGYISDKYSRKRALFLSIIIMSIPTALVGCLPTYQQVGILAPILLVLIRVAQGFAVGGEFTSTMVFLVEHAPPHQRGLHGSWAFASVMVGVLTGSLVAMFFTLVMSESVLYAWGWRLPFLLSILGSAVGVYIRRHLRDPEAQEYDDHHPQHHGTLRRVLPGIAEVVLVDFMNALGFYLVVIFLPLFLQKFVHLSHRVALGIHTSNMVLYMVLIPVGGWLSDKHGRMRVILLPCLAMAAGAYPLWALFKTGSAVAAWAAQAVMAVLMALFTGALPATFVALFPTEYRCTALSIGHNLSMAAFGGTAPIMATAIMRSTGDIASPAALLIVSAALSAAGALLLKRWRVK